MSLFRVNYLSFFFILISVFSFFNIIYSYYFNLYLNLNTYYFSLLPSLIIGLIFYKIKEFNKKPSIFEKILTVLLGYILIPIILSLPFYFSIYNLTFLNSIFESVSGFTSTGFTIFDNIKHIHKGTIETAYTILNGEYEVIEAEIIETSELINKELKNSNLPEEIRIGAVLRDNKVVIPRSNFVFQKDDRVVFLAKKDSISVVENIFRISSI